MVRSKPLKGRRLVRGNRSGRTSSEKLERLRDGAGGERIQIGLQPHLVRVAPRDWRLAQACCGHQPGLVPTSQGFRR